MVFINDKKFACEACIKGHRSSSCAHNERPLYEVKKKGRPVSQCERCRELRTSKKVHSKCTCSEGKAARMRETERAFGTKQKRYIPIVPALPNGLQDAFHSSRTNAAEASADVRQKVDSLLNPCPCADVWSCQCDSRPCDLPLPFNPHERPQEESSGLAALARAAELFSNGSLSPSSDSRSSFSPPQTSNPAPTTRHAGKHNWPPNGSLRISSKRRKRSPTRGPELPPLLLSGPSAAETNSTDPPPPSSFTPLPIPSFSTFSSLAGSGCTCGLRCSCPGCPEHQPGERHKDVGEGCRHCVDDSVREVDLTAVGFGMKWTSTASSGESIVPKSATSSSPVLDRFLARAARVPPPPAPGGAPVTLPKLCCEGSCGCGVVCGCGGSCQGCCSDGADGNGSALEPPTEVTAQAETPASPARGSCCS